MMDRIYCGWGVVIAARNYVVVGIGCSRRKHKNPITVCEILFCRNMFRLIRFTYANMQDFSIVIQLHIASSAPDIRHKAKQTRKEKTLGTMTGA